MPKRTSDIAIFLILYAISITFFVLKTYGDATLFSATIGFAIMFALSVLAALYTKAEDVYYRNLDLNGLIYALIGFAGMVAVSSLCVGVLGQTVLYYPTVGLTLTTIGGATSVFTSFLGEIVYQFTAVATGEEFLKFVAYSVLKKRYGSIPLAAGIAVGLWAGYHALQAYANILYVIPAFLCGIILIAILELTKSIFAPILAHGLYNSTCLYFSYAGGSLPTSVPWFPVKYTSADMLLTFLAIMWTAFIIIPILMRRK